MPSLEVCFVFVFFIVISLLFKMDTALFWIAASDGVDTKILLLDCLIYILE